jgi:hypothetical protein
MNTSGSMGVTGRALATILRTHDRELNRRERE